MRRTLPIAILLTASLALVPGATAQEPFEATVTVTAEQGPTTIEPAGPPGMWNLEVELSTNRPPPGEVHVNLEPELGAAGHDLGAIVSPSTLTFEPLRNAEPDTRQEHVKHAKLAVAVQRFAPAYHATAIHVVPEVQDESLTETNELPTQVTVVPSFRPGLDVKPNVSAIEVPAGDEGHAAPTVRNVANGVAHVSLEPVEVPAGCSFDAIDGAIELRVLEEDRADFHVACDQGAEGGTLAVEFHQTYAPDRSVPHQATEEVTWNVEVDEGSSVLAAGTGPVAGSPAAGLSLVALVGLAWAVRRRG